MRVITRNFFRAHIGARASMPAWRGGDGAPRAPPFNAGTEPRSPLIETQLSNVLGPPVAHAGGTPHHRCGWQRVEEVAAVALLRDAAVEDRDDPAVIA